jgi:TonB family protein
MLAEQTSARTLHAIGIFDANIFERRVMRLTGKQKDIRGMRRLAIVTACVVMGIGTCASAVALHVDAAARTNDSGAQTPRPKKITVSAEVMAGNSQTKVTPVYPPDAKKARIQGTVVLKTTVGSDGKVEDVEAVSGPKELQQSALDAVRQWTYKPYLLNGEPIEVETQVSVIYSLEK